MASRPVSWARAGALASDWYYLGRVRSLDEIQSAVQALTPARVVDYVRRYPPRDLTVVTLGPRPLALKLSTNGQPASSSPLPSEGEGPGVRAGTRTGSRRCRWGGRHRGAVARSRFN